MLDRLPVLKNKLFVWAFIPYKLKGEELVSEEYDTPACRQELADVFAELGLAWKWQPITLENMQAVVEEVAASSNEYIPLVLNYCEGLDEIDGYPGVSVVKLECQKLYANVAGEQFQLNTPDFPFFSEAIEQIIQSPQGWCHHTLKKKEEEFGKPDPNATYLRITLGVNQGESPGIPYVLEIWPNRHYSPIHNHAGANAAIKVLHSEITVKLFDMLSVSHTVPFKKVQLKQGDITWIAPRLNQTHQLHNENEDDGSICVTIQCYLYDIENNSHYEFFDYIDNDGSTIRNFLPNSDMNFLEFRDKMKSEWEAHNCK